LRARRPVLALFWRGIQAALYVAQIMLCAWVALVAGRAVVVRPLSLGDQVLWTCGALFCVFAAFWFTRQLLSLLGLRRL